MDVSLMTTTDDWHDCPRGALMGVGAAYPVMAVEGGADGSGLPIWFTPLLSLQASESQT
jgi:hypothetical protein